MIKPIYNILAILVLLIACVTAQANKVEIVDVKAHQNVDKTWTFAVTLKHGDTGWNHYANEWQVIALDKKILATRTLYHPHVDEQPFTRNISGVKIPASIKTVRVIAKDTMHGLAQTAMQVNLTTKKLTPVILEFNKR